VHTKYSIISISNNKRAVFSSRSTKVVLSRNRLSKSKC